jgi:hypothetical protein
MAYKQNWDPANKATKEDLFDTLMKEATEYTDNRYMVTFESDDGGVHAVLKVERNEDDTTGFKVLPELGNYMGWRLLKINVPHGYLDVFYNEDGTKRPTKRADDD